MAVFIPGGLRFIRFINRNALLQINSPHKIRCGQIQQNLSMHVFEMRRFEFNFTM